MNEKLQDIENQIDEINKKMADPDLCKNSASTFSRITGYYRNVENWNIGKRYGEYISRRVFDIK
jgi:anaerobic ribonucleoside-triphosphate reductase